MAEPKIKIVTFEEVMELHEEWLKRLGGTQAYEIPKC
jgi:hypothetical protein